MFTNQNSLAGTSRVYTQVQFRLRGDNLVNVQVAGPSTNRSYGAASQGTLGDEVLGDFVAVAKSAEATNSLAGTDKTYRQALARREYNGDLKWQIPFTVTAQLEGVNENNLRNGVAVAEGYVSLRTEAGTFKAVEDALASANESNTSFVDDEGDEDFSF